MKLVDRVEFILDSCKGKTVLHLGCTNWPYTKQAIENDMLLHFAIGKEARELYGLDFDQEGIDVLESHGITNLYCGDLEKLQDVPMDQTFEVIVAGEMIEHLNNPGLFLDGIQRFMDSGSRLVITTINAYGASRFLQYGLRGKGGTVEPVHLDHVAYYSFSTLKLLVERAGLSVNEFYFYDIGQEHRPYNRKIANAFNDLCVRFAPQLGDGIIAVCSKSPNPGNH